VRPAARPCFVPPAPIRALRDYTRARTDYVRERTRCYQRLEKLLEGALIKLSSVASKLTTESAKDMVCALIAGERDPHVLAGLARTRMKAKHDALVEALTGLDMTRFPTAAHLVSWAGLCPAANQSGPRVRAGKKKHGNAYLRGALGQAALGAARTGTFLGERYRRVARRRGKAKAQVAVARSILTIIWHLLADPAARYTDLGPDYAASRTDRDKKIRNHIRQLQALGLQVTLTPAA
jgi:transposase